MNAEQELITKFYSHFQQSNWKGMLECYHEEVFFYDPIFGNLEGRQVWAMWEMLLGSATNLKLTFKNVEASEGYGSCDWVATYIYTPTGRKVINKARAHFFISEGKIVEHQDDFSLWKWSYQAMGIKGMLLGWTSSWQNGVRGMARRSLDKFIATKAI